MLAWLSIMVRSRSLDRWRRKTTRREDSVTAAAELVASGNREGDPAAWATRTALSDLPAEQREPLELAYWEGLSPTEVALRLNLPLGTVKTRMRTGLRKLREVL